MAGPPTHLMRGAQQPVHSQWCGSSADQPGRCCLPPCLQLPPCLPPASCHCWRCGQNPQLKLTTTELAKLSDWKYALELGLTSILMDPVMKGAHSTYSQLICRPAETCKHTRETA